MRAYVPAYGLKVPRSLDEALKLLDREPGRYRLFAGGTDLMVLLEAGQLPPGEFLSLWGIRELRGIKVEKARVSLGALTTYTEVREAEILRKEFPMLVEAAKLTGAIAIQNRGTLGGNLANASPAADSPPALLCYDAELELVSRGGRRVIPYADFHQGYKKTALREGEIIARVYLPRRRLPKPEERYHKVGTRLAQAISKVCFAARAGRGKAGELVGVRLAWGSVAPVPLRSRRTEGVLEGQVLTPELMHRAMEALSAELTPIDDIRSEAIYRRQVARNLLIQYLEEFL
jgi:CO/xanthine dehydrogenase FAD-binding subunit